MTGSGETEVGVDFDGVGVLPSPSYSSVPCSLNPIAAAVTLVVVVVVVGRDVTAFLGLTVIPTSLSGKTSPAEQNRAAC